MSQEEIELKEVLKFTKSQARLLPPPQDDETYFEQINKVVNYIPVSLALTKDFVCQQFFSQNDFKLPGVEVSKFTQQNQSSRFLRELKEEEAEENNENRKTFEQNEQFQESTFSFSLIKENKNRVQIQEEQPKFLVEEEKSEIDVESELGMEELSQIEEEELMIYEEKNEQEEFNEDESFEKITSRKNSYVILVAQQLEQEK